MKKKELVIVRNPGNLFGLTIEDLGTKSKTRNSLISDLLLRTSYVEKLGTGFLRMNDAMHNLKLTPVNPESSETSFALILESKSNLDSDQSKQKKNKLIPPNDGLNDGLNGGLNGGLNEDLTILFFNNNPGSNAENLAENLKISKRSAERYIKALKEKNIIEFRGSKKTGGYYVIEGKK